MFCRTRERILCTGTHRAYTPQCTIDALRRATGKNDLARPGANKISHVTTRLLDAVGGVPTEGMATAGCVTIVLLKPRYHRRDHTGAHCSSRVVVEIHSHTKL